MAEIHPIEPNVARQRAIRAHKKTRTGCITCKLRRVKCDETRPSCQNCQRTNRSCEGYDHPQEKTKPGNPSHAKRSEVSHDLNLIGSSIQVDTRSRQGRFEMPVGLKRLQDSAPGLSQPIRVSYVEPILGNLLHAVLPSYDSTSYLTSWLSIGCQLALRTPHKFLKTSLVSLSLVVLSQQRNDQTTRTATIEQYHQCLPQISHAIKLLSQDESRALHTPIIVACLACGLCEFMLNSWSNSDRHLEGIMQVIQHGGPKLLKDPVLRRLIYEHRTLWLGCCCVGNRPSGYSQRQWLDIGEMYTGSIGQTVLQRLCDRVSKVLPFIYRFRRIEAELSNSQLQELLDEQKACADLLWEWRRGSDLPDLELVPNSHDEHGLRIWRGEIACWSMEIPTALNYFSAYMIYLELIRLKIARRWEQQHIAAMSLLTDTKMSLSRRINEITVNIDTCIEQQNGIYFLPHTPFAIDTCWKACEAIQDITPARISWFQKTGSKARSRGYSPFTEPWLTFDKSKLSQ